MKITFVALAFNECRSNRQLIDSLIMQTNPNWEVIIYHNGASVEMKNWATGFNDPRVKYIETEVNNDNACLNRLDAINNLVTTQYIIQTSIQDYYLSWAVELILKRLSETRADFCYWDSINHLCGHDVLITKLQMCYIDWGNFCIPIEIAKQIGIPGFEPTIRRGDDWYTVEKGLQMNLFKNITKINNVLTIHN
jgi:glycosyltransferase involved in cell wall biosynthesis